MKQTSKDSQLTGLNLEGGTRIVSRKKISSGQLSLFVSPGSAEVAKQGKSLHRI